VAAQTVVPAGARTADLIDGLAVWYKLDAAAGTVATDSSGHGRHGTVNGTAGWSAGEGLAFNGTDTYVRLPDSVLSGLDSITVAMDVLVDPAQATPYFIYGLGNSSGATGNGYLFATGDQLRTAIASGNWSTEQNTRPAAGRNLLRGAWKHLAYTQTGTTGVLYEDGVEVARNPNVTITPGSIGGGVTTANYIGRSVYSGDRYLQGRIRDLRLYERAIGAEEVDELATPVNTRARRGLAHRRSMAPPSRGPRTTGPGRRPSPSETGSTTSTSAAAWPLATRASTSAWRWPTPLPVPSTTRWGTRSSRPAPTAGR